MLPFESRDSPDSSNLDSVFETFSDDQRRRLLCHLSESPDGTATVDELRDVLDGDSRRTETRLRHVHLPHLESLSLVEYDERSETVRYRENPLLEELLDCCFEHRTPRDE